MPNRAAGLAGLSALLLAVTAALVVTQTGRSPAPPPTVTLSNAPSASPAPQPSPLPGHVGPPAAYPRADLTPGETMPGVTAAEVCAPGYSLRARNVPQSVKDAVYRRYGVANTPGANEVDHMVPIELAGANSLANLWIQPYTGPWNAHIKDQTENKLHVLVCNGTLTLDQAVNAIKSDWVAAYEAYVAP